MLSSRLGDLFLAGQAGGGSLLTISTLGAPVEEALERKGDAMAEEEDACKDELESSAVGRWKNKVGEKAPWISNQFF